MSKADAKRLTKAAIDRMPSNCMLWDSDVPGFLARSRNCSITFLVTYRFQGRQRWYSIGRYGALTVEQARKEAMAVLGQVSRQIDPASNKEANRNALTVQDGIDLFLETHVDSKLKSASQNQYKDILQRIVAPKLGKLKLQALTRNDVARLHDSLRDTPVYANRMLAVVSAFSNWAERRGYRPEHSNPCRLIPKYKEQARERFLSIAELATLGDVLRQAETIWHTWQAKQMRARLAGQRISQAEHPLLLVPPMAVAAIRLLLLTGARLNEILTLQWEHVDLPNQMLRLPDSKTGAKTILLNAPAKALLEKLDHVEGNPYVIAGNLAGKHLVGLQKIWERVRTAANLQDVRLHDLRHSYASMAVGAGYSLSITGKLLGHTQAATTQRYAHLADDPLRAATGDVGQRIAAALG